MTPRLKSECLWMKGFHEDVWSWLLTITFSIGVPMLPVVEIHVNICEEIWRAAGQRPEHFVLVQTRFLFDTTKHMPHHSQSLWYWTSIVIYEWVIWCYTLILVHENRISWMNPSWLLLLVGFAYKSLKHLDLGHFIHTETNNVYITNPMQ